MSQVLAHLRDALADKYEVEREIGRGGMATVYLAQDIRHARPVALKVLHPELAISLGADRFLREIQIAARLQHSHIVPLYDSGKVGDLLFYVMPYVEGESLRHRMSEGTQLPVEAVVRIGQSVAGALDYAHRQHVVHRDVKPENILLREGEALVADFGIAKALSAAAATSLTAAGISMGTPAYMSPEQASGEIDVDGRADVYSLGAVLYEALTGAPPFDGPTPRAIIAQVFADTVRSFSGQRDDIPGWLEEAILRSLAKEPRDRFATAADFSRALALPRFDAGDGAPGWKPIASPKYLRGRSDGPEARQSPSTVPPRPNVVPLAAIPFVGRTTELAALQVALDNAARGRGSTQFIVGEGGIGKTRLALAAAELAATKGFARVMGRAYPVETGIPYAVLGDAFLPLLRAMPASVLQVRSRGSVAELETLFPSLTSERRIVLDADDVEIKPRLFDVFSGFVHRLCEREPMLVTFENLHWADPSSLELLHFLARGATAHRMVLLCTYDDTKRDSNRTLRTIEQSLRSLQAVQVQKVLPLTHAETLEIVQRQFSVSEDTASAFVGQLHDRTRGNPYFIEETLKALVASGHLHEHGGQWTGWTADELELPPTIRDAVGARIERLSADARKIATIAAVVGVQVPHALFEEMSGLSASALLEAIDELRADRLFAETEVDGQLAYEFTHPMLREVLYSALSRARARALHADVADALERFHGDRATNHSDTLALHFLRAESPAQAARGCRYLVAAGRSALDRGANSEAAEALEAALAIVEQGHGRARETETVLDLLARAQQRLGNYKRAAELWQRAVDLAEARGDTRTAAGLNRRLGVAAFWTGRYDEAIVHYDRGLTAAEADDPGTALLLLARSAVHLEVGRAAEAESDIRRALAIAERSDEPGLRARAHHAMHMLAVWHGPPESARTHGPLSLEFALAAGDRGAAWTAEWAMALQCGLTGDSRDMLRHLGEATRLAEEIRSPVSRMWTDEMMIEYHASIGAWDEAVALADRTIADARAFSQFTLLPRLLVWSSLVHFSRGEFEIGTAQMQEAWTVSGAERAKPGARVNVHAVVPAHVSRATWHLAQRQFREALEVAEAGLAIADRTGYVAWAIHRLVPIAGEASLYLRDFDRSTRYGERLRIEAERLGHPLGLAWSEAAFAITQLLQGDPKGAIAPLTHAIESFEAIPFVEFAARVRRVLADAYYESGDTESAVRELRRVHEVFARIGAKPWLDHVREKFRQLGVRPPSRSAAEGSGVLTAREAEIANLVAARKSNKEIAAALEISARTVGTHLSNIFAKLGVDSRGALTDLVRAGALETEG
jgi:DNA-binding CsgD family transcriptional regulator/tRNA A-37 threonylcarbamoyl transferase component Bud32